MIGKMKKNDVLKLFNEILITKDPDKAWDFFNLDLSEFSEQEKVSMKIELFDKDWHKLHEELAQNFQLKKSPLAVDILYKNAFRQELDIFEYKPLARKCTWALADIGTPKAKMYLEKMADCGDEIIEKFAKKRLDNWENELSRKG